MLRGRCAYPVNKMRLLFRLPGFFIRINSTGNPSAITGRKSKPAGGNYQANPRRPVVPEDATGGSNLALLRIRTHPGVVPR
jgi:hypothetical protein